MKKNWLAFAMMAFVAAFGLSACGDDETACDTDLDCSEGQSCFEEVCRDNCATDLDCGDGRTCTSGVCLPSDGCVEDLDCRTGETCDLGSGNCIVQTSCTNDSQCDTAAGESCQSGVCIVTGGSCTFETQTAVCAAETAFCSTQGECVSVACGEPANNCSRCGQGPTRSSTGPVIFDARQVGSCTEDLTVCQADAPFRCEFSFQGYSVGAPLPSSNSAMQSRLFVISGSGSLNTAFGVRVNTPSSGNTEMSFRACFPQTQSGNIGTAVMVRDTADNASNSLCISGNL